MVNVTNIWSAEELPRKLVPQPSVYRSEGFALNNAPNNTVKDYDEKDGQNCRA